MPNQAIEAYYDKLADIGKEIHRREIQLSTDNDVAMANDMVLHSASNLSLNELKILRFIIMQTKKGDSELFEFEVTAKQLAEVLDVGVDGIYKDIEKMSTHIMKEVITIGDSSKSKWIKFHWVDVCQYDNGRLKIKISDELKPFLIGLRGCFTKYRLSEIVHLQSIYAIRLYEILNSYMDAHNLPHADVSTTVSISIDDIKKATGTTEKYERYSSFKAKVIDAALKEINRCTSYHVTATPYKNGRSVQGFEFWIESQVGYAHRTSGERVVKLKLDDDYEQMKLEI